MRTRMSYLLGLSLMAIAALGAYRIYAMATAEKQCVCAYHLNSNGPQNTVSYRHAPLRA